MRGAGVGVSGLRPQEPLDPPSGDLAQGEVLERRQDLEPHLIAVALLGALGQIPRIDLCQPQGHQIRERAGDAQVAAAAESGADQQAFLEQTPRE